MSRDNSSGAHISDRNIFALHLAYFTHDLVYIGAFLRVLSQH